MRFLQIRTGVFVRMSDISFVEDQGNGLTRVATVNASWDIEFPIETLMKLVEADGVRNNNSANNVTSNKLFGSQYFAG